jgi:hypothetical protein
VPDLGVAVPVGVNHWGALAGALAVSHFDLVPCQKWVIPARHSAQTARAGSDLVDPGATVIEEQSKGGPAVDNGREEEVKGESCG